MAQAPPTATPASRSLPGGLTLLALPQAKATLATVRLALPAGAARSGKGRSGLAGLAAELLRRGTKGLDAHGIDDVLERLGSDLHIGVDDDLFELAITVPPERLVAAAELVARLVRQPTYPARELQAQRLRSIAQIKAGLDEAEQVADRALWRALFHGHPYADPVDGWTRDLSRLTRPDLVRFHAQSHGFTGGCLAVAGRLPDGALDRLARLFSSREAEPPRPPLPRAPPLEGRRVVIVDKPNAAQAQLRLGAAGLSYEEPDYVACALGAGVLGGGFSSRLVDEVRVKRGLTYGIAARFQLRDQGGLFAVRSFTRVPEAATLVEVCLDEIARLREEGPREEELSRVRAYFRGSFLLGSETASQLAATLAGAYCHGLGPDWLERYPRLLEAVPLEAVTAAIRRHLWTGPCRLVAVGPARPLSKALRKFGDVEVVSLASLV
ncbi:MAG: M16 family metallopeptidase [Deltaproteobacteria bacterium]